MKILAVYPKDVYTTVEFSAHQIDLILEFLDNVNMQYNSEEKHKLHEAVKYINEQFVPTAAQFLDDIKPQGVQNVS